MSELEDMQNKMLEYQTELEELKTSNANMQVELDKTKSDLASARDLNQKLIHKMPAMIDNVQHEEESHPETPEEFMDSFIKIGVDRLKRVYGENCL